MKRIWGASFGAKINRKRFQKLDQKWDPQKSTINPSKGAATISGPCQRAHNGLTMLPPAAPEPAPVREKEVY